MPSVALRKVPTPKQRWSGASQGPERAGKGAETTQAMPQDDPSGGDVGMELGETATPHRSKSKWAHVRQVGRLVQCRRNRMGLTTGTWVTDDFSQSHVLDDGAK